MAKRSFTLHLAKPEVNKFVTAFTEAGQDRIRTSGVHILEEQGFADGACLFIFDRPDAPPAWLKELRSTFPVPENIKTKSVCAVLLFRASDRMFAASFAHGWMYLDDEKFEGDFGIRAAINALDDHKLKRLERANLGDAMRGVSQSPFQRDFRSFGLDDVLDLVRKVSGSTRDSASSDAMTGASSLKVVGDYGIGDLPNIAAEALEYFNSTQYRETSFEILDVVMPVSDKRLSNYLDFLTTESIKNGMEEFELGLPTRYDDDGITFKFLGPGLKGRFPDLLLKNYVEAMGGRISDIEPDTLRDHRISAEFLDSSRPDQNWTIRKALVGSLVYDGGRYAINEGEWYRIDEEFKRSIESNYRDLVRTWEQDPVPLRKIFIPGGREGHYQTEASYNAERAMEYGYVLLDAKNISVPEIQRSEFEPCDLLDVAGKRFIHVKKSSRRSNILSHFFKQGSNSAQNFKRFPGAWDNLFALVQVEAGDKVEEQLRSVHDDRSRRWTVEFWIADSPRSDGSFNIPFFSKISLRDEVSNLRAMEYEVVIRFIGHR
ncbi:DUF6119 family protein [Thalassobaculum sp.]|uniref:DUF6119 family protein n=1 Tax=Thalassobaculum sp. TaxID=2022740 RepID=UPI003B5A8F2D